MHERDYFFAQRTHQTPGRGDATAQDPAPPGIRQALPPSGRLQGEHVAVYLHSLAMFCKQGFFFYGGRRASFASLSGGDWSFYAVCMTEKYRWVGESGTGVKCTPWLRH